MAFREVTMLEIKEVLWRWLMGGAKKAIARQLGVARNTVRRYIEAAEAEGLTAGQGTEALTDEILGAVLSRLRSDAQREHGESWATCEARKSFIANKLDEGLLLPPPIGATALLSLAGIAEGVDGGFHQWVDLDGEGIPGVLSAYDRGWTYKRNQGGGKLAPPVALGSLPSPGDLGGGAQFTDLAGDGQLDLVAYTRPLPGYFTRTADGGWRPFVAFHELPNLDWNDPNLRFLDLDGDGHPDVLVTEHDALRWYRSRAKDGFEAGRLVSKTQDEREGPAVVFADGTETLFLADMSGDGLTDLVRVRNGQVCYWPNLGYGRFGKKVTLAHSPSFDTPDRFDPGRVRLADIDGSGTTDIIYLGHDGVAIYLNQSGNALSERVLLRSLPVVDAMTTLSVVDLLGQGTACLVWSSPLPGQRTAPIRYVDLMGGKKPHLLTSVVNNLGGETRLTYVPSTKFYLQDRAAGRLWLTRLAFPVHVLEQVERLDHVAGSRLVTRFAYHHGFFDGHEREFRGFAKVEQWDAESFEGGGNQPPYDVDAADPALNLPPVRTVTWFHTGAWLERERLERELSHEYYQDPQAPLLPDTVLPPSLTLSEQRQAARALRGAVLRQEIYAEDGTPESVHPYTVSERNYEVRLVQPAQGEGYAVLFTHPRETVDLHYERRPNDPRLQQALTLEVDDFGNVTQAVALAYPRRAPEQPEQGRLWAVLTQSSFANRPDESDWYRVGVPVEVATAELTGLTPPALGRLTAAEVRAALAGSAEIPYEAMPTSGRLEHRVVERQRILYYRDDLSGPLPLGDIAPRALPFETYRLALTPGLVAEVYGGRVNDDMLANEGRYVQQDGLWWAPSGRVVYDDAVRAAALFFLPEKARDPFGQVHTVVYDPYALLVREARDPLGNVVVADHDYRVLAPHGVTDPNANRTAVAFDALGMVVKTAVMGKEGAGEGDTLEDPTMTLEYDLHRFVSARKPAFVKIRARERHHDSATRYQESYSYTDGTGREVMRKVQAEPGLAPARDGSGALVRDAEGRLVEAHTDTRWVGTGRTVFDNKGNPIKQYEPFFSSTPEYESEAELVEWGVTPILRYDPVGRLVRTDSPDGTFSRVLFDAWRQETWDPNDTVLDSRWYTARGSPDPGGPEPRGNAEARAAWLAAQHAQTPAVAFLDPLGRTFLAMAHNRFTRDGVVVNESYETRTALDVEGNPLSVTDARGVVVLRQVFDVLGRVVATVSSDAGERKMLADVGDKPVRAWDGRDHAFRHVYDALQRPTHVFVATGGGAEALVERMVYGESLRGAAVARNLRGQVLRHYDGAGVMENVGFDFKGNLLEGTRQVTRNFREVPDWSALAEPSMTPGDMAAAAEPLLETETFALRVEYDALNRVVSRTTPDGSETLPSYNEAGLLEAVEVRLRGASTATTFIENIDYNARGQRTLCEYGNGTSSEYTYDPETFRLTRLVTLHGGDRLQDLAYTYDPVGNITEMADAAQQTLFFAGAVVEPRGRYVYDAVYWLIEAEGREHPGQQPAHEDYGRAPLPHPNDGQALRSYTERYVYDPVGNIARMEHTAPDGKWTRRYQYAADSNRLLTTSLPGDPERGPYSAVYEHDADGSMTRMPHLAELRWDHGDRLVGVDLGGGGRAFYGYDGGGERVRKVVEKSSLVEERIYLGGYEVFRKQVGGNLDLERETLHIMDDQRRVALVETMTREGGVPIDAPAPRLRYQLDNHLGSSLLELDGDGGVITYEEYFPYGGTAYHAGRSGVEVSAKRYRYTGKERDEETGLYYHGARYYAPWLGRWTSPEPRRRARDRNLFAYVDNQPILFHDPDGLDPVLGYAGPYGPLQQMHAQMQELVDAATSLPSAAWQGVKDWGRGVVEGVKQQWKEGSTADRVELAATLVGTAAGAAPYVGDYVSLASSVVAFGAKPSWGNAAGVGLDTIGAALPLVPALGTLKRAEKLADAAKDAEKLAEAAKDAEKIAEVAKDTEKVAEEAKEARVAVGATPAAEGAVSRIVPGGGLAAHEAKGGHLLLKHVGQSEAALSARLAAEPHITAASTFLSRAEAEAGISAVLDARAVQLSTWVSSGAKGQLVLRGPFSGGTVLQRGAATTTSGSNVTVVLRGTGSGGWRIHTGYPTP